MLAALPKEGMWGNRKKELMHPILRGMAKLELFKGKEVGKFERNLNFGLKPKLVLHHHQEMDGIGRSLNF